MHFTTFHRYQCSMDEKILSMAWVRQDVLKSGCLPCAWRVLEHSRSIIRLIKYKLKRNGRRYMYNLKRSLTRVNTGLCIAFLFTSLLTPVNSLTNSVEITVPPHDAGAN